MDKNILETVEVQYDWNSWNQLQNTYNLRVIDKNVKYPKHLLIQATKEMEEWAKFHHVDYSFYKYVSITKWDCTYSVTFYDGIDMCYSSKISVQEIYYDSKNKKILQSCICVE